MKKNQKSTLGRSGKRWNAEVGMLQQQRKKPRARAKERTLDSAELLQGSSKKPFQSCGQEDCEVRT